MENGSHADHLLGLIALPLVVAAAIAPLVSLPLSSLLGVGAIPSAGSLGYALFCSPVAE